MKKSEAVVVERPREAGFRLISLSEMHAGSLVCRTTVSAISSGTDMKTWRGLQHPEKLWYPCVPGYENVGVVAEGGVMYPGFEPGDRVMINECRVFGDVCGAWGGNSEFVIKNKETATAAFDAPAKIPGNVSENDAVLAYLASVALKGVSRVPLRPSDVVLVIGAGMVGISAMQIVKIINPSAMVICLERNEFRRNIAANFADIVLAADGTEVSKIEEFTDGKKADAVIECSGNPEVVGRLHRFIKDGGWGDDDRPGHIHLQGDYPEPVIWDSYHRWFVKNCTITMTCALKKGCKEQILAWMSEGKFKTDKLPVEVWPVGKCAEAFEYLDKKKEDVFKIVFDWRRE